MIDRNPVVECRHPLGGTESALRALAEEGAWMGVLYDYFRAADDAAAIAVVAAGGPATRATTSTAGCASSRPETT